MRIDNTSRLHIQAELLLALAEPLGLSAKLPGWLRDELGMYSESGLLVEIRDFARGGHKGMDVTTGSYTYGEIRLNVCPRCKLGSVVHTYLHELTHAWIHQFHEPMYDLRAYCDHADRFADDVYRVLGGKVPTGTVCHAYELSADQMLRNLDKYRDFVERIRRQAERLISKCDG